MPRQQKPFTFSNGVLISVWQANWDQSMERSAIEEQARADRERLNGSGDPELLFFQENIYAGLAAVSQGDVPSLESAFRLLDHDLDDWYMRVQEMNPTWYLISEVQEIPVRLGDYEFVVQSMRPSVLMRRMHIETELGKQPSLPNIKQEVFRVAYYPRLAGCSVGNVPSVDVARTELTETELQTWYDAAKQMIPAWFETMEEQARANQDAALTNKKKSLTKKPK